MSEISTLVIHGWSLDEWAQIWREFRRELAKQDSKTEQLATETDRLATETDQLATETEQLATRSEQLATKAKQLAARPELQVWGRALVARIAASEQQLIELQLPLGRLAALNQFLLALIDPLDLARHAGAFHESMRALMTAHDDKYADLPPRVKRLKAAVFEPEPR